MPSVGASTALGAQCFGILSCRRRTVMADSRSAASGVYGGECQSPRLAQPVSSPGFWGIQHNFCARTSSMAQILLYLVAHSCTMSCTCARICSKRSLQVVLLYSHLEIQKDCSSSSPSVLSHGTGVLSGACMSPAGTISLLAVFLCSKTQWMAVLTCLLFA